MKYVTFLFLKKKIKSYFDGSNQKYVLIFELTWSSVMQFKQNTHLQMYCSIKHLKTYFCICSQKLIICSDVINDAQTDRCYRRKGVLWAKSPKISFR